MKVEEKLLRNFYRIDQTSHIEVNKDACRNCDLKPCTKLCPAGLYSLNEKGEVTVEYSGCLECGTCSIICPKGAIRWNYPRGGYGVQYRFG